MATPLNNHPEWDPSTTDGSAATSVTARSLEQHTVLRFASAAARDAAFTAAGVVPEANMACALADDPGAVYVNDGTNWLRHRPDEQFPKVAAGKVTADFSAENFKIVHVTFPADRFTEAPEVIASYNTSAGAAREFQPVRVYNVGVNGCDLLIQPDTSDAAVNYSGSYPISWIAVQDVA